MVLPTTTRPSFPWSQSLPSGNFHKPLSLSVWGQTEQKLQSQKTNQTDHMDHSLVWLNETMSHVCRVTQDWWFMVENSDKNSSGVPLEKWNGKPCQQSCIENSMNIMKRQKDMTWKDELPRTVDRSSWYCAKMGTIKGRNSMDLTEDIKKRWQEYTEELCKKRYP